MTAVSHYAPVTRAGAVLAVRTRTVLVNQTVTKATALTVCVMDLTLYQSAGKHTVQKTKTNLY